MHHSAKRDLAIACRLSVRLSVCLSMTLVDQDHICWKSWKLIARTISPTPSLFLAQRPYTYECTPGEHGEIVGRLDVGEKGRAGAQKRQYLWNALSNGTIQTPTASSCVRLGVRNHHPNQPKTSIAIISGMDTDFKLGRYIHRVHPNKYH